jgi:hypothetical protein
MKLTEDNILMNTLSIIRTDNARNSIKLGTGTNPVVSFIRRILTTLGINVNLRMNGNLTQPQEQLECLRRRQKVVGVQLGIGSTLYTMIELLLLGTERKDLLMNDRVGGAP